MSRVPERRQEVRTRVRELRESLSSELGRSPAGWQSWLPVVAFAAGVACAWRRGSRRAQASGATPGGDA